MAEQASDNGDGVLSESIERDSRALAELYDDLQDADIEWSVAIESDDLSDKERNRLRDAVNYTIGDFRFIVGKDRYIPSGVYWSLVSEYAAEVMETLDENPEWADDDLSIFREIVMPSEMSRFYDADPVANFSVLYHSRHHAEGWLQDMNDEYYGHQDLFYEYIEEDQGWKRILAQMAYAACVQDVAQEVRSEGYEVDLQHFEYER